MIEAVDRARRATGTPMAVLSSLPETLPEAVAERLIELGVVPFSGLIEAIEAMDVAAWMGRARGRPPPAPLLLPTRAPPARCRPTASWSRRW